MRLFRLNPWTLLASIAALLVAAPVLVMLGAMLRPDDADIWRHLQSTVLPRYLRGSLFICLGTVSLSAVIGVGTAWLVTRFRFPGSRMYRWALLLPLAMPAYVLAYCWTDLLEYAGPVQASLRERFELGRGEYWFPEIRSLPGAIFMMSLTLYPYVFLSSRASFLEQGSASFETARSLGWGPWRCFLQLAIPLARPGIVAGCSLVAMESLADYGTVDYFGVQTFTTGIYRTWHGFGSYISAVRLAAILLFVIIVILLLERASRGKRRFSREGSRQQRPRMIRLHGLQAAGAHLLCSLPLLFGFFLPTSVLLHHTLGQKAWEQIAGMRDPALTSFSLAAITAVIAVAVALALAYARRLSSGRFLQLSTRIASAGYAIPGSVVGVAVVIPLAWMDNQLIDPLFGTGLLLSGTVFALIFAYLVRFLAVAFSNAESGLQSITPSMDQAARSLGSRPAGALARVHMPLAGASLLTAALIVFVDVLKELPATLLLRPATGATLAVRVHQEVSQESLHLAAPPALAIVLTGLIPVFILTRSIAAARRAQESS